MTPAAPAHGNQVSRRFYFRLAEGADLDISFD
jgi:hypothetical protein